MGKRDKEIPYEVVIQERKRVDLYGNVVYYIYWFDKYGYNITNEWKFWSKGPKKKYDRVNRYLTDSWLKEYCGNNNLKISRIDEERLLVEERIKAGYYSAESIEKRREEAHKAKMSEKRAEICERYDKKIRQAEAEKKIMLCVFDYGLSTDNVIYYSHTNTLSFNWDSYGEKITQEEFDDFVNKVDRSQLPEGIKFELK